VGEEGLEAALAGAEGTDEEVIGAVADLLYHVLVLLKARGVSFEMVITEPRVRHSAPS
jgi:phosphoribosyl-AMP cyclohydrolase / phosphoribosyl-ATP pyrophosphohydrolase